MKFLCPNCKAKYRIGPEKMVGRQAAKIRCRKCDYLIQITYRSDGEEFDVTASPPSVPPPGAASARANKPATGQLAAPASVRARPAPVKEEGIGSKKPTAAVPGLPGLGSAKSTRAALVSDTSGPSRRPLAPLPPPPVPSSGSAMGGFGSAAAGLGAAAGGGAPLPSGGAALAPAPSTAPPVANGASLPLPGSARSPAGSTQLGDQFRESVQAGAVEELPREGWFVGVNGVPLGPIPLGDLRELAIAGHIDRRSLVWREGQPEWRPLGKFPGLARVIDDGAAPPNTPQPPSPESPPPPAMNGAANGTHVASGFDIVRPDLSERPSAWGDLDDDDDDDEQPTTVKGRVSVLPSSSAMAGSLLPPSAPQAAPPAAPAIAAPPPPAPPPAYRGNTSSMPAFAAGTLAQSAPAPSQSLPASTFGLMPDADAPAPPRSRARWYLIAAAIVFAFALGATVTLLMRSSAVDKSDEGAGTDRSGRVSNPLAPAGSAPVELAARRSSLASASAPSPGAALMLVAGARAGASSALEMDAVQGMEAAGLDAKAVQRTARRYGTAVRERCWHRALGARAPGVPSSAKVTASITVEPTGRVQAVSVSGAPRGYPGLARCIQSVVRHWRFPRAAARTITSVPFMFVDRR